VLCILHAVNGRFVGGRALLLVLLILAVAVFARWLVQQCCMRYTSTAFGVPST
jgi:hypothetical protein